MEEINPPEKSTRKKTRASDSQEAEPPFEEALKELEQLAAQMERGDMSLDDAVTAYDRGIKLSRLCRKKLDEAEGKIQKLTREAGLTDFVPEGTDE